MKKLAITLAIILGLGLGGFAQGRYYSSEEVYYEGEGGLFGKGPKLFSKNGNDPLLPGLPDTHGGDGDSDGDAPLGSGVAVLVGLGTAYLVRKKRRED